MNTTTPRVFIAATRQNDGKTTTSLGLLSALQKRYPRIGYIKPVGQRFVEIEEQKIDEDTVLMDRTRSRRTMAERCVRKKCAGSRRASSTLMRSRSKRGFAPEI